MNKNNHRKTIKKKLLKLPNQSNKNKAICLKLNQWLDEHQPNQLGAFFPTKTEPNIWPILTQYAKKNPLFLPKFNEKTNRYEWAPYTTQLPPGKFNIPEPKIRCSFPPNLDTCLVPALGIDQDGNRLGWGHGYFDQLISTSIPHRIGIIYECQYIKNTIKADHWDIPLTEIITETLQSLFV